MVTTTEWIDAAKPSHHLRYGTATIDNGETASLAVPNHGRAVVRIGVPTITVGTITFTVTPYQGATARTLKDSSGNTVTVASSTGGFVVNIPELSGCYEFTIVTAAQGAAREFQVQMVGLDPVPSGSNEVTIEGGSITANQGTQGLSSSPWFVQDVPVTAASAAATQAGSTAEEDSIIVKATAGNLYGFVASSTVAGFIQVHNSATLPANTAVPFQGNSYAIAAGGTITLAFDPPLRCSTGIVLANSTTQNALTVATGDDTLFGAQYV